MTLHNGQVADAITSAKQHIRDNGVHYEGLTQDTKLLLYTQDWQTDRMIGSITPKIDTLVRTVRWSALGVSSSLLANVAWEAVRFFVLH